MEPAGELRSASGRARSCIAATAETSASTMPSGTGWPSASSTAGVVMRWPTLRTSSSARPRRAIGSPSRPTVLAVVGQAAHEGAVALGDLRGQVALHQAQPGAVGADLVRAVDGGDRVLEVDDGRHRRLQHDVGDARGVGRADGMGAVDQELDPEPVVLEEQRGRVVWCAAVAVEGGGVTQAGAGAVGALGDERPRGRVDGVAHDVGVRAVLERHDVVEEGARPGDDAGAAGRVVRTGLGQVAHGVGAVERVVQRTPPRVGRVDGVAGVRRRHDELRSRERGDLGVHAGRVDLERLPARHQVADRLEERPVGGGVVGLGGVGAVPLVDLRLQPIAHGQHVAMSGRERPHQLGQPVPDLVGGDARPRYELGGHELVEGRVDSQAAHLDVARSAHGASLRSRASSSDTRA